MSPVAKALLSVFDEAHEKKAVRSLIRDFEKQVAEMAISQMEERDSYRKMIAKHEVETSFWRSQFEQVQARLEKLQGRV
jgi:hypothetical protein